MRIWLCVVILAGGLMLPSAAAAATLSLEGMAFVYTAAPGEVNVLDVRLDGTAIVFTETGAAITSFRRPCAPHVDLGSSPAREPSTRRSRRPYGPC